MTQHNGLTPAQAERLFILSEELGEVQQAIGKILRHGYYSFNPFDPEEVTNQELLEKELGHIGNALKMLIDERDLNLSNIEEARMYKASTIGQYLHHQEI